MDSLSYYVSVRRAQDWRQQDFSSSENALENVHEQANAGAAPTATAYAPATEHAQVIGEETCEEKIEYICVSKEPNVWILSVPDTTASLHLRFSSIRMQQQPLKTVFLHLYISSHRPAQSFDTASFYLNVKSLF